MQLCSLLLSYKGYRMQSLESILYRSYGTRTVGFKQNGFSQEQLPVMRSIGYQIEVSEVILFHFVLQIAF